VAADYSSEGRSPPEPASASSAALRMLYSGPAGRAICSDRRTVSYSVVSADGSTPLNKSFESTVAYSTDSSSLIQANAVGIGECSPLSGNRVVSSRSGDAKLIPTLCLAGGISKTIQDGSDLVIAVAPGHPADDIQGFQW